MSYEAAELTGEDASAQAAPAADDPREALRRANASVARLLLLDGPGPPKESVEALVRAGLAYLHELEERRVRGVLDACGWNITRTANCMGMSREAFQNHLRRKFPRLDQERRNRSVASKSDS